MKFGFDKVKAAFKETTQNVTAGFEETASSLRKTKEAMNAVEKNIGWTAKNIGTILNEEGEAPTREQVARVREVIETGKTYAGMNLGRVATAARETNKTLQERVKNTVKDAMTAKTADDLLAEYQDACKTPDDFLGFLQSMGRGEHSRFVEGRPDTIERPLFTALAKNVVTREPPETIHLSNEQTEDFHVLAAHAFLHVANVAPQWFDKALVDQLQTVFEKLPKTQEGRDERNWLAQTFFACTKKEENVVVDTHFVENMHAASKIETDETVKYFLSMAGLSATSKLNLSFYNAESKQNEQPTYPRDKGQNTTVFGSTVRLLQPGGPKEGPK